MPRTYEARVAGVPDDDDLARLRSGIPLDGHRTQPAEAVLLGGGRSATSSTVVMTIKEGRNRQVRRMLEAVGHPQFPRHQSRLFWGRCLITQKEGDAAMACFAPSRSRFSSSAAATCL